MNIVDLLFDPARRDRVALIDETGTYTYGRLQEAVGKACALLEAAGLPQRRPGHVARVGLACPNGVDHVIFALAILRSGGCLVPIAGELAAQERETLVRTVGLDAVIVSDRMPWLERRGEPGRMIPLPTLRAALFVDLPRPATRDWDEAELAALNPAFIRFSSGTTGRAKGVILSHESLLARIETANRRLAIGPQERIIWVLSMAHHFAVSIMLYLVKGAATVIVKSHLAEAVLDAGREHGGTIFYGSPFHHSLLAAEPSGRSWPTLRLAISTAAPLPAPTAAAFHERFGVALSQALGMIEIGLPFINDNPGKPASIGSPLEGIEASLRDPGKGTLIPACDVGELWVRCEGMFDAYLTPWQRRCDLLASGGWFRTGDLARQDADGALYLVGRCKTVINVGGMKCFPEEIEAVLQEHPGVWGARVYALEHPRFGNVPAAEIVAAFGAAPTIAELIALCRSSLASYKIPVQFRFVAELPRTASGKVRRETASI
ncbi:MAG TPA: class I adenylate-forming enzyme family protein [Chthoniobacteraceae bacterium]|nr:class I adenylate-forming enzyme family protein [Chthoniobacteraceae bacterium]